MVQLEHEVLQSVLKPSRYTGGEWNAVVKDWDKVDCTFALALPDVYEVGMSNLGLAILYEILNQQKDIAAERVYAPWTDMEKEMRDRNIPLFSLETKHELAQFDFFGFSLQYEMIYSNVLNMLDLAGIPLWAKERGEDMPFVVGGGPCVYNVEPIADFFDFFIVGEGEEVIVEISEAFMQWKKAGRPGGRKGFLERLLTMDGIYVPSFYEPKYTADGNYEKLVPLHDKARPLIYKRVCQDMNKAMSVERPLVPSMDIVHNRAMLELFRGCSRGCRFCQAGICYRPARERTEEKLKNMARDLVDSTGYNEMSMTSLSSADYSCLGRLVDDLMMDFRDEEVSFSLPSLRIDSFSIDLAHKMQQVRKSGLTFAPEAGTQRLRDVINKGVTEENLMTACASAFKQGWKQVKLYFMMGLPTETDEDVIGIAKLAKKVVDLYTEIKGKRGCKVTISVACFVPKPYTPFQWFGQLPIEEFQRRQELLKAHITDRAITFNYHDARLSVIEGVFARGDRRLAPVLYQAWRDGAKFDGWSDLYQHDTWLKAMEKCGIDGNYYNQRTRDFNEALPWEITSPGVNKEFLLREWKKAMEAALTEDCRRGKCSACGICPNLGVHVMDYAKEEAARNYSSPELPAKAHRGPQDAGRPRTLYKFRAEITKGEPLRYVSHLDYANLFIRAFKRSGLPMAYSEGFNHHMKVSFASALSLGVTSEAEYMEFELLQPVCQPEVFDRLKAQLPPGVELRELREVKTKQKAMMAQATEARYRAYMPLQGDMALAEAAVKRYNEANAVDFQRVTPKKKRDIELKKFMKKNVEAFQEGNSLVLLLDIAITDSGSVKPSEVIAALVDQFGLPARTTEAKIVRTAMLSQGKRLVELV
ncbi:MAG: TIGR03960 family B12-binding radical SAM protein [Selenomonas sp.]|uniref:TIGR03960 family B12-binding radical SAM protein n=1 Tax=Selenomonas sp. TaxID=2053611 RepID=UPI0025ED9E81|nr:TIGR03960 family B12-binding radical SAM protein [Selenomonas sp.]MCR5758167.1 TIGR03960 family B12-binding radical SAM protein [Selenomonas sp.]